MPGWRKHWRDLKETPAYNRLTDLGQLAWLHLITEADREGRFIATSAWLRARLFPLRDDIVHGVLDDIVQQWRDVGLIDLYEHDGMWYGAIRGWHEQQRTDREAVSKLPAPPTSAEPTSAEPASAEPASAEPASESVRRMWQALLPIFGYERFGRRDTKQTPSQGQQCDLSRLAVLAEELVKAGAIADDMPGFIAAFPYPDPTIAQWEKHCLKMVTQGGARGKLSKTNRRNGGTSNDDTTTNWKPTADAQLAAADRARRQHARH